MRLVGLFIVLIISSFQYGLAEGVVKGVALLFRHGDRAPLASYPEDPYANYSWPGGFGALSPKGAEQAMTSGALKAERYADLKTGDHFDRKKIYLQSSNIKRCVESAEKFLSGFLESEEFPHDLIHVLSESEDEMLTIRGKPCPKYDWIFKKPFRADDPEIVDVIGEDRYLLSFLSENTGLDVTNLRRYFHLSDTFKVQLDNGFDIPDWADGIYESHIKRLGDVIFTKWTKSARMQIRSGRLLEDILRRLDEFTNKTSDENILLYSAHDLTLAALMVRLGIVDQTSDVPDYLATLAVELHDNEELVDDLEIQLFYFKDTHDDDPVLISIPDCEEPCPFKKFKSLMRPKVVIDYDAECRNKAQNIL